MSCESIDKKVRDAIESEPSFEQPSDTDMSNETDMNTKLHRLLDKVLAHKDVTREDWVELIDALPHTWIFDPEHHHNLAWIDGLMIATLDAEKVDDPHLYFEFREDGTAEISLDSAEDEQVKGVDVGIVYEGDWNGAYEFLLEWANEHLLVPELPE